MRGRSPNDPSKRYRRLLLTTNRRWDIDDVDRLELILVATVTELVVFVPAPAVDLIVHGERTQVV